MASSTSCYLFHALLNQPICRHALNMFNSNVGNSLATILITSIGIPSGPGVLPPNRLEVTFSSSSVLNSRMSFASKGLECYLKGYEGKLIPKILSSSSGATELFFLFFHDNFKA